ncbi:MAG: hypothetical protein P8172_15520 [Gammaproteobacteria bacterium]
MSRPDGTNRRSLIRSVTVVVALSVFGGPAFSQDMIIHLPMDDLDSSNAAIGGSPRMYVKTGEATPQVVPGKIGQAIEFDSRAVIALPFDLNHNDYPAVTITAWVRQGLATSGTRAILSSGSDAGARLGVNGGRLAVKAGRTGVSFDRDMPKAEWVFVAAVIDVQNGYARLHQDDAVFVREGIDTYEENGGKQPYVFVGGHQFRTWQQTARRLTIDDVRVYAGVLSPRQIDELRSKAQPR